VVVEPLRVNAAIVQADCADQIDAAMVAGLKRAQIREGLGCCQPLGPEHGLHPWIDLYAPARRRGDGFKTVGDVVCVWLESDELPSRDS